MTTIPFPPGSTLAVPHYAAAVADGLLSHPKTLSPWLFYDEAGSLLFDRITEQPEYYLTRTERAIFAAYAEEIIALAAGSHALQIAELGAGSCDKTRLILRAAADRQDTVLYEPIDVSAAPLDAAREGIETEIPGVLVSPRVGDYTHSFALEAPLCGERRLVLYIGSSIGNFDPAEAHAILCGVRATLTPGDALLLGVDMVKDTGLLHAAYNDAAGVTAEFNLNMLRRLNRELGANFKLEHFAHHAVWNSMESRMEMHLESRLRQIVTIPSINVQVDFEPGETIHTENSYKYSPGEPEQILAACGFRAEHTWTDEQGWFAVSLARAV